MNHDGTLNRAYFPRFMRKLRREGYFKVSKPRREGSEIYLTELCKSFAKDAVIPIYRFVFLGIELENAEKQAGNNPIHL